jgi:alkenylglycerophosphocholine hydrolase
MKPLELSLHITFLVAALLHIGSAHKLPYTADWALKALPVLCLAALAALYIPGTVGLLLCIGFVLSAGGDISLSFKTELNFLVGLSFFLLAHIAYTVAFAQAQPFVYDKWWVAALIVVFAVTMAVLLFPKLGAMRLPVLGYLFVILCMGVLATLHPGPQAWLLIAGASLFMLSDSLIAVNKFLAPFPNAHHYIMVTYYAGQYLICRSFLAA